MFHSSFTINGWVEEFSQHLQENYGALQDDTKLKLDQLNEVLGAFDKSSILAVTDSEGVILEVNDTFCEISGYSREELIGRTHRIVKSKHHPPEFFENLWKTIKSGKVWTGEIRNRKKRGGYYWVKTAIFPITDEKGEPERFISVRTDITEVKEYEEKLRKMLEEDYSNLIKNLQDFVLRLKWNDEEDGAFVSLIEGKLARELGLSTEKMKGKLILPLLGEAVDKTFIQNKINQAFNGTPVSFEFQHDEYYLHISLSPVFNEQNKVKEVIGSVSNITELKKSEMIVREMAFHEHLTGLPNRRALEANLRSNLLKAKEENKKVALVLIDLDGFKNINDALGHTAGDQFIIMTAERLQYLNLKSFCDQYKLYHIGGDEFLFILFGISEEELHQIVLQILSTFQEPYIFNKGAYYQGASIGVSVFPDTANNAEEMMKHADLALYEAKQGSNGKYQFFNHHLKKQFISKVQLENELWNSVNKKNQFELHYQPIIHGEMKEIIACEALLRWKHPEKDYISPIDFIPIAEETGLIIPIGEWVIDEACRDLKSWGENINQDFYMSINLSPRQILQSNFVKELVKIVEKHQVHPSQLQLEITENALMENIQQAIKTLNTLHDLGFRLAIDDFGTGYSSLSYLKQFPVHCLKIDKSFVKDLPNSQADRAIVSSTVQLGKELGLSVIAEGVETNEAQTYLQSIDCPFSQGYFFSKPLTKENFTQFMEEYKIKNI